MRTEARRIGNALACGALVVMIASLLVATWMPAIVAGRRSRAAATSQPASQPSTTLPTTAPTSPETE